MATKAIAMHLRNH